MTAGIAGAGGAARRTVALVAGVVVAATLLPSAGATAQTGRGGARLVVSDLTAVVGPGALAPTDREAPPSDLEVRALVENDGEIPLDELRLVVETFASVDTRSQLRAALDGGELASGRLHIDDLPVAEDRVLEPGEITGLRVAVSAEAGGWADADRSRVYPVQLTVLRGTEVLDQVRTAVVYLDAPPVGILETAFVWPLDAPPWRDPGGTYPPDVGEAVAPGSRLDRLLGAVEHHVDAGVLLAPAPHLVEDLVDRADGFTSRSGDGETTEVAPDAPEATTAQAWLERLRAAVADLPFAPVVGPYADADVGPMAEGDPPLPSMAGTLVSEARRRLDRLVARQPDPATYLASTPLTPAVLSLVPGEHLLVRWENVVRPDLADRPTAEVPYPLREIQAPSGRQLTATVADPWLSELLATIDDQNGPALAAHRVVVETAGMYIRRPGVEGRPLLVLPPLGWDPPGRVAAELLEAFREAPWIRLTTPSAQVSRATAPPISMSLDEEDAAELPISLAADLAEADLQLGAVGQALPEDTGTIDGRTATELREQLFRAGSIWLRGASLSTASALVRDTLDHIDGAYGEVEVPAGARITLTSDRGTIPVTLQRPTGGALWVRVEVDSPGRLAWPEGESRDVLLQPEGTQTVSFDAVALGRGTFSVTVTVRDPGGTRILEQTTLAVRSTEFSGPALLLTGIVVALLVLRGLLRRNRPDRPRLEVVRDRPGGDRHRPDGRT